MNNKCSNYIPNNIYFIFIMLLNSYAKRVKSSLSLEHNNRRSLMPFDNIGNKFTKIKKIYIKKFFIGCSPGTFRRHSTVTRCSWAITGCGITRATTTFTASSRTRATGSWSRWTKAETSYRTRNSTRSRLR